MNLSEGYYDMHTHILPDIDDGAKTMEETMQMLEFAYRENIRSIIATPHFVPGNVGYDLTRIMNALRNVLDYTKEKYPDMKIYAGNEFYYREGAERYLKQKIVLTIAGSDYLLVEFNERKEFRIIRDAVYKMTQLGYRPIIAHAERYVSLRTSLQHVEELIALGAYIQVNSDTVTGSRLNPEHHFCEKILKENMVHFVGSDCHNLGMRKPVMKEAVEYLIRKTGKEKTQEIICDHMDAVVNNEFIEI